MSSKSLKKSFEEFENSFEIFKEELGDQPKLVFGRMNREFDTLMEVAKRAVFTDDYAVQEISETEEQE